MNITCLIFGHVGRSSDYLLPVVCICSRCGEKINSHKYGDDGICINCGEIACKQSAYFHNWNGCRCRRCYAIRDVDHNYVGCKCAVCGSKRDAEHDFNGCTCKVCGKVGGEGHILEGCACRVCHGVFHNWVTVSEITEIEKESQCDEQYYGLINDVEVTHTIRTHCCSRCKITREERT